MGSRLGRLLRQILIQGLWCIGASGLLLIVGAYDHLNIFLFLSLSISIHEGREAQASSLERRYLEGLGFYLLWSIWSFFTFERCLLGALLSVFNFLGYWTLNLGS